MNTLTLHQIKKIISANIYVSKSVIILCMLATLIYISWWFNLDHIGNIYLYAALVVGEIYHVWQAFGYSYTIWDQRKPRFHPVLEFYPVDVFITVCGEPASIVRKTLEAACSMDYPNFTVFVLNDGYSAKKENWKEIDDLAREFGAIPITRRKNKGAKAGNINNALKITHAPFVAVFDADHRPQKNFLIRTLGYFANNKLALVQTPQYYENREYNYLTNAAWEQQELFFGPICRGKNRMNATFWCGTNAVLRREALESIGGVPENNIAEDFLASLFLHENGWRTLYIPEILALGLAPNNLKDYVNQQYRWARGSLEVIFKYNPLFKRGLTFGQKMQYLYSAGYYLNGLVVLLDALIPIIALYTNILPVKSNTSDFMVFFFPFIFSALYMLVLSTNHTITFSAIQVSMSSFYVFIKAAFSTIFGVRSKFDVTSKSIQTGNYLNLVMPQIAYTLLSLSAVIYAVYNYGWIPSVITNTSWVLFNIVFFAAFLRVAYPWKNILTFFDKYAEVLGLDFLSKDTVGSKSGVISSNITKNDTVAVEDIENTNKAE